MKFKPISARYESSKELATIRKQTTSKRDDIPFLLLPVRIETRFMEVERPLKHEPTVHLENSLIHMMEANAHISSLPGLGPIDKRIEAGRNYLKSVGEATSSIKKVEDITTTEKGWLKEQIGIVEKKIKENNGQSRSPRETVIAREIERDTKSLKKTIDELPARRDDTYERAGRILAKMNKLHTRLKTTNSTYLPFSNPKNKKDLYRYLEKTIDSARRFYKEQKNEFLSVKHIEKQQYARIMELHAAIQAELQNMPNAVGKKFKNASWKSFVRGLRLSISTSAHPLFREFDEEIAPVLSFRQNMPTVRARTLFYQSIKLRHELRAFAQQPKVKRYGDIANSRKRVARRLDTLNGLTNRVIEGTPDQIEQVKNAWRGLEAEFDAYANKIKSFRSPNPSENHGAAAAESFIREKGKNQIRKFADRFDRTSTIATSKDVKESALFYASAAKDLDGINRILEGIDPAKSIDYRKKRKLLEQLGAAAGKFRSASRRRLVYASDEYKNISENVERLKARIETIERLKEPERANLERLSKDIETSLRNHNAVLTDSSHERFEELRDRPVFATSTYTADELWVRIYPDDIAAHTHEESLTPEEREEGISYWKGVWLASGDRDFEIGAWKTLCSSFGSKRAAWIAGLLDPTGDPVFDEKPSGDAVSAIRNLGEIRSLMQPVHDGAAIMSILDEWKDTGGLNRIKNLFTQSTRYMRPVTEEQEYLLEKLLLLIRSVGGKCVILESKIDTLTGDDRSDIQDIFDGYAELLAELDKIQPLPSLEYLAKRNADIRFPETETKNADWTVAPRTYIQPDRFVFITRKDGAFRHIAVGKKLSAGGLQIGLDPAKFDAEDIYAYDENGELIVDPDLKWMTDFDEAVKTGMGIIVPLTPEEAENGIDQALVLGIRDADEEIGRELLETLLANHHYAPDGMSLLKIGTPTNNTEENASGFRSVEEDFELSYRIEREDPMFDADEKNSDAMHDGKRLADALGIDPALFQHIENSDLKQISRALIFNRALWPATIGYYMDEMLDKFFSYDTIDRTRSFFNGFCTGRGFVPSIRVGTQPYGLLVTTAFSRFDTPTDEYDSTFYNQLASLLRDLHGIWSVLRKEYVPHAQDLKDADPQEHFMNMLGLHATSVSNYIRYGSNLASRNVPEEEIDFNLDFKKEEYSPSALYALFGKYFTGEATPEEIANLYFYSRIYQIRLFDKHVEMAGPHVDRLIRTGDARQELLSDTEPIENIEGSEQNYIDWLLESDPVSVFGNNDPCRAPSDALLFMLLRHSLLLAYSTAALDILEREDFYSEKHRKQIISNGHFSSLGQSALTFFSRWSYLFMGLDDLQKEHMYAVNKTFTKYMMRDGRNAKMSDYLFPRAGNDLFKGYQHRSRHNKYFDPLNEVRDAVVQLRDWPTRELDGLLSEHIDLCTYRLDAWMLALAHRRLFQQRYPDPNDLGNVNRGIYIGAYGWVEELERGGARAEAPDIPDPLRTNDDPIYRDDDNEGCIHAPSINQAMAAAVLRCGYLSSSRGNQDITNKLAVNISSSRVRMALDIIEGVRSGLDVSAILGCQLERGLHERYTDVELDRFILPLRKEFPLSLPVTDDANTGKLKETGNVIDGLALLNRISEGIENSNFPQNDSLFEILYDTGNLSNCPQWLKDLVTDNADSASSATIKKYLIAIIKEIDRMADAFDAVGDLAVSESVYQIVRGNHVRAAAVVNALSEGKNIPYPQVIDTPRTGTILTQRVVLHFEPILGALISAQAGFTDADLEENRRTATPPGWRGHDLTPRALAEPSLNNWLGSIIGHANKIKIIVEYDIENGIGRETMSVSDLRLQPIDLIHIMGDGFEEGGNELVDLIAYRSREKFGISAVYLLTGQSLEAMKGDGLPEEIAAGLKDLTDKKHFGTQQFIDALKGAIGDGAADEHESLISKHAYQVREIRPRLSEREKSWAPDVKTIYDLEPLIRNVKEMIMDADPVTASAVSLPGTTATLDIDTNPGKQNHDELLIRVQDAENTLKETNDRAATLLEGLNADDLDSHTFTDDEIENLRDVLGEIGAFGVQNAVPSAGMENNHPVGAALVEQLMLVLEQSEARTNEAAKLWEKYEAQNTVPNRINTLIEIARCLFGGSLVMLPHYEMANKDDLAAQLGKPDGEGLLRNAGILAMENWLQSIGAVRTKMHSLEMARLLMEMDGRTQPELAPVQLPAPVDGEGDYWLGAEYPDGYDPDGDRLSVVFVDPARVPASGNGRVGVVLDEWTEILPRTEETTGIAFNYDAPDATAPQCLLLAVTPEKTGHWSWDDLVYTLIDTLEMAKNRAVEPEHIEKSELAQILPGIMGEVIPRDNRAGLEDHRRVVVDFLDNNPEDGE